MAKNSNLQNAKRAKNDEFYTMLTEIEQEVRHYLKGMQGKDLTILCNCDDPFESNFFKYFTLQFHKLGLKRLIGISYAGSPIAGKTMKEVYGDEFDFDTENHGFVVDVSKYVWTPTEGFDWDIAIQQIKDFPENKLIELEGDGSFLSDESVEYLKQADVVVSNPPFSNFRPYVNQLMEYEKNFLILGNINAITYKEIFPLIKEGKIFAGHKFNKTMEFKMPSSYELNANGRLDEKGNKIGKVPAIAWYTNIDHNKRHDILGLSKSYYIDTELFPTYDNYDAIEVNKVKNIPWDYPGVMGVPITFIDKFNPQQFEIIGATESEGKGFSDGLWKEESKITQPIVHGAKKYKRIFIKNKLVDTTTEEWKRNYQNYQNRMKQEEATNENNA